MARTKINEAGRRCCPNCNDPSPYRSRRRLFERVLSLTGLYPYRCVCGYRFYRRRRHSGPILEEEPQTRSLRPSPSE